MKVMWSSRFTPANNDTSGSNREIPALDVRLFPKVKTYWLSVRILQRKAHSIKRQQLLPEVHKKPRVDQSKGK